MALTSNFISFIFFTILLSSLQLNARESQFFSKVTRVNNNDNNNNKYSGSVSQTEFTPETENNYGLYGHESGLHPPTTTTTTTTMAAAATTNAAPYTSTNTYHTYKTESEDTRNNYYNTNQNELSDTRLAEASYSNNNKDAYESKQNELSDTKYIEEEEHKSMENQNNNNQKFYNNNVSPYTTTYKTYRTESEDTKNNPTYNNYYNKDTFSTNQNDFTNTRLAGTSYSNNNNNNNNKYNLNNDAYVSKQNELSDTKYPERGYKPVENQNNNQRYSNNNNDANERYNGERQGLSDTRFMDGGKYFFDAANSERHNPTLNGGSSRGINPENLYNNKGYIGRNNANSYENKKYSMEGYQNQDEFEDDQDNFEAEP